MTGTLHTVPMNPWIQTVSGRAVDLVNPTPDMIDLERDIPEALARIARFNGHVAAGPYSVAQHCVLGARAIEARHGREMAVAFLLHDAHEAYSGDIATPVAGALQVIQHQQAGCQWVGSPALALTILKHRLDAAIFRRACVDERWLEHPEIKRMDGRMLMTERRDLLGPAPHPWPAALEAIPPLRQRITVWPWPRAADEYRAALRDYLPPMAGFSPPRPAPTTTLKRPRAKTEGLAA